MREPCTPFGFPQFTGAILLVHGCVHFLAWPLTGKVERVIFEAHSEDLREGAMNFAELLESRIVRFQHSRQREDEAIASISDRIAEELEKESLVRHLRPTSRTKADLESQGMTRTLAS